GYDSDEPTTDVDVAMVAHNSIFDPLDGSVSHRTPDSDIEIDELEFEGTPTSVAKDPQGESRTLAVKLLKKTLKPTQNASLAAMESPPLTSKLTHNFSIFAASEFKRDFKKRSSGGKNGPFKLNSDELFRRLSSFAEFLARPLKYLKSSADMGQQPLQSHRT
ncbi:hypothetical protein M405DRAFT_848348, partial [Rhizopogon salebrosus TDB-379]